MENLDTIKNNYNLIKLLYSFIKNKLNFDQDAKISFVIDKSNYNNPLGKTAYYDPETKKVCIYIYGRHIKDILRSIAHELIHHSQNCRGDLSNINTVEGYAQNDNFLREMEREAYETGNMLFRDFEDDYKRNNKNER